MPAGRTRCAARFAASPHVPGEPSARGGKAVKALRGTKDRAFRLRVGDLRVIYDLIEDERVNLVLGVVNRRNLERFLRS